MLDFGHGKFAQRIGWSMDGEACGAFEHLDI